MADYLSSEEFESLQAELASGAARLVVTRRMARQFFINVGNRSVRDLTGESVLPQKALVLSLLLIAFGLIASCLLLTIQTFGWIAMVVVPLTGIFWTIIVGFTTEYGSALVSTLLLVPCLLLAWFLPAAYLWLISTFVISIYCYRIAHNLAQRFLTDLLSRSYDAYDMLSEQIKVTRDAS